MEAWANRLRTSLTSSLLWGCRSLLGEGTIVACFLKLKRLSAIIHSRHQRLSGFSWSWPTGWMCFSSLKDSRAGVSKAHGTQLLGFQNHFGRGVKNKNQPPKQEIRKILGNESLTENRNEAKFLWPLYYRTGQNSCCSTDIEFIWGNYCYHFF